MPFELQPIALHFLQAMIGNCFGSCRHSAQACAQVDSVIMCRQHKLLTACAVKCTRAFPNRPGMRRWMQLHVADSHSGLHGNLHGHCCWCSTRSHSAAASEATINPLHTQELCADNRDGADCVYLCLWVCQAAPVSAVVHRRQWTG